MLAIKYQITNNKQSQNLKFLKFKYLFFGIACYLGFVVWSFSSYADIVDTAFRRGIGVRAAAMGGAYSAIADDASAIFYNPAGLAEPGVALTYGNLDTEEKNFKQVFQMVKFGYLGYANWQTSGPNGDNIGVTAFGFGNRSGWLNWGMNYKSAGWTLGGTAESGWSGDFGAIIRLTPQMKLGLVAQDLVTSKGMISPTGGRFGLSYASLDGSIVMDGDIEFSGSSPSYGHFGLEAKVGKGVSLRGGIDRGEATAGFAFDFGAFAFDYAAFFEKSGQTIHRFEAGVEFLPRRERPFSIIKPKEFALIDLSGPLKGGQSEYSFLGGYSLGVDSLLTQIRQATKDKGIDGIMIRLGGFNGGLGGMAMVQELRGELERARAAGKKIVVYAEGGATGDEYYLAAAADRIVAPPGCGIGGLGKSIEIIRLKGLYEKFGIDWDTYYKGKYKMTFNPYSDKLTPPQAEMLQGLVADLYRQLLTDVASDRRIELERLKKLGDGSVLTSKQALKLKLIDEIGYFDDARRTANELAGGEEREELLLVQPGQLDPSDNYLFGGVFGVAVIEIDGDLVTGAGGENFLFGGRYVGADTINSYLRQAADDIFVKAIILRINSPGGTAVAAGEIYRAVQYAKSKGKTVIASIGDLGASGGYYIAAAADKIVADRASIVGSIGIYQQIPVFAELLKKVDSTAEVIKEGEHTDMYSGLRERSSEEAAAIGRLLNEGYQDFINAVAAGRKLATKEVEAAAQGRIYTGNQALEVKLVDQLGGFADAVDLAKLESKTPGEPRLIFYHQPSLFFPFGAGVTESLGLSGLNLPGGLPGKKLYN